MTGSLVREVTAPLGWWPYAVLAAAAVASA